MNRNIGLNLKVSISEVSSHELLPSYKGNLGRPQVLCLPQWPAPVAGTGRMDAGTDGHIPRVHRETKGVGKRCGATAGVTAKWPERLWRGRAIPCDSFSRCSCLAGEVVSIAQCQRAASPRGSGPPTPPRHPLVGFCGWCFAIRGRVLLVHLLIFHCRQLP